jgi:hypothetical protein
MLHVAQLVQVLVLARRHIVRHLKQTREQMIEERDQRRLLRKFNCNGFSSPPAASSVVRHFTKDVDVRTAKAVDRLFADRRR